MANAPRGPAATLILNLRSIQRSLWDDLTLDQKVACIDMNYSWKLDHATAWTPATYLHDLWNKTVLPMLSAIVKSPGNNNQIFKRSSTQPPLLFRLYMISETSTPKQSKPTIVVLSPQPDIARRTVDLFKISRPLTRLRLGFGFRATKGSSDAKLIADADEVISTDSGVFNLCGRSIWIALDSESTDERFRKATVGGVLLINESYYGLTAAHAFLKDNDAEEPDDDIELPATVERLFAEQAVQDCTIYLASDQAPDSEIHASHKLRESSLVKVSSSQGSSEIPTRLISITNDWALFQIEDARFHGPNVIRLADGSELTAKRCAAGMPNGPVLVAAGASGIFRASSSGIKAGFIPAGHNNMMEVWVINKSSIPGDCGSWVVDPTDGSVYAMVVASSQELQETYCVGMDTIIDDIRGRLPLASELSFDREHLQESANPTEADPSVPELPHETVKNRKYHQSSNTVQEEQLGDGARQDDLEPVLSESDIIPRVAPENIHHKTRRKGKGLGSGRDNPLEGPALQKSEEEEPIVVRDENDTEITASSRHYSGNDLVVLRDPYVEGRRSVDRSRDKIERGGESSRRRYSRPKVERGELVARRINPYSEIERDDDIRRRDDVGERRRPPLEDYDEEIIIRRDEREEVTRKPSRNYDREEQETIARQEEIRSPPRNYDRDEREERRPRPRDRHREEIIIRRDERDRPQRHKNSSHERPRREPALRDYEREEIIIRSRERSRSVSPARAGESAQQIIRAPAIHQEVITHHRHIDHGFEFINDEPIEPELTRDIPSSMLALPEKAHSLDDEEDALQSLINEAIARHRMSKASKLGNRRLLTQEESGTSPETRLEVDGDLLKQLLESLRQVSARRREQHYSEEDDDSEPLFHGPLGRRRVVRGQVSLRTQLEHSVAHEIDLEFESSVKDLFWEAGLARRDCESVLKAHREKEKRKAKALARLERSFDQRRQTVDGPKQQQRPKTPAVDHELREKMRHNLLKTYMGEEKEALAEEPTSLHWKREVTPRR